MLDTWLTQGDGLHAIAARMAPRVITVACLGDPHSELPLLWNLCNTLAQQTESFVTVLDGTTSEQADNPGLLQMMHGAPRSQDTRGQRAQWIVVPSALGLRELYATAPDPGHALTQLGKVALEQELVVLYAPAAFLEQVLANTGIEPLLAVSCARQSRLSAYQAMKRLLLNGGLHPTIATMVHEPLQSAIQAGRALSQQLQDCAMHFLGYRLEAATLMAQPGDGADTRDLSRLAERLLERAHPLHPYVHARPGATGMAGRLAGSH